MYFVLTLNTEETLATTRFEDVAKAIAEAMPVPCMVRYSPVSANPWYKAAGTNFFSTTANVKVA